MNREDICTTSLITRELHPVRVVTKAEHENDQLFHSLRHFPELRKSKSEISELQNGNGRDLKESKTSYKAIKFEKQLKQTHGLDLLKRSALDEIHALKDFRKLIVEERMRQKALTTPIRPKRSEVQDPLESANQKLAKVAFSYDSRCFINVIDGFLGCNDSGGTMSKVEFGVQLKRCMNIMLSKAELDAMFLSIDVDGDEQIDGVEFTRYFFSLGNEARHKQAKERIKKELDERETSKLEKERNDKIQRMVEMGAPVDHTEADLDSAMGKLARIARRVDPSTTTGDAISCLAFEMHMTPMQFKDQIEKSFEARLSHSETSALVKKYSTRPGDHSIDGHQFIKQLLTLRRQVISREREENTKYAHAREKRVLDRNQKFHPLPKLLGR